METGIEFLSPSSSMPHAIRVGTDYSFCHANRIALPADPAGLPLPSVPGKQLAGMR